MMSRFFSHLILVVFENHSFHEVADLPGHQRLAKDGAVLLRYHGVTHPSGPNYRAWASGETWGPKEFYGVRRRTIADALAEQGAPVDVYRWKGTAADRHQPFLDCQSPWRDRGSVPTLDATSAPLVYLGLDDQNNGHSAAVSIADDHLRELLDTLDADPWFNAPDDASGRFPALCVVYDEGFDPENHVFAAFYGRGVTPGATSDAPLDHFSLCRTLTDNWDLPPLERAATAQPITGIWRDAAAIHPDPVATAPDGGTAALRVATLNVYYFGARPGDGLPAEFFHTPDDDQRLAELIRRLDPAVLALQEIVDVPRLESVLARVDPAWRIRDAAGRLVATPAPGKPLQRVVVAWRADRVDLLDWSTPITGAPRRPVVCRLRVRGSGADLCVIAVHTKSSDPLWWPGRTPEPPDSADPTSVDGAKQRWTLCGRIERWLASHPDDAAHALVLGDFNAVPGAPELRPLGLDAMQAWQRAATVQTPPPPAGDRVWSTSTDQVVIDQAYCSPAIAARLAGPAVLYAFDLDPTFPGPADSPLLRGITDHRPLSLDLDL
jgi:endonuclease/exonuclease/phosphatase family metal-dependent hydrolase